MTVPAGVPTVVVAAKGPAKPMGALTSAMMKGRPTGGWQQMMVLAPVEVPARAPTTAAAAKGPVTFKAGPVGALVPAAKKGRTTGGCHTRFLCHNQVLIVCMTQDQLFHTYGPKVFIDYQMSRIKYNYYISKVSKDYDDSQ
jgi:hypothetical protein